MMNYVFKERINKSDGVNRESGYSIMECREEEDGGAVDDEM
jgi:hypothetical protein